MNFKIIKVNFAKKVKFYLAKNGDFSMPNMIRKMYPQRPLGRHGEYREKVSLMLADNTDCRDACLINLRVTVKNYQRWQINQLTLAIFFSVLTVFSLCVVMVKKQHMPITPETFI